MTTTIINTEALINEMAEMYASATSIDAVNVAHDGVIALLTQTQREAREALAPFVTDARRGTLDDAGRQLWARATNEIDQLTLMARGMLALRMREAAGSVRVYDDLGI